ncbi:MAG: DUF1667 domain-containing protein [Oscillospiraceae bacterium]|nr:DUF1667 domain-containing protein [Oscillospiraceae bacterium]
MNKLFCLSCHNGCLMSITGSGITMDVQGNKCAKGYDFALAELTDPMITLTTTVRTKFPDVPVISVRTDGEIPRNLFDKAMAQISDVLVEDELSVGDTVIDDVAGSGVAVIITSPALMQLGAELENKHAELNRFSGEPPLGRGGEPSPYGAGASPFGDGASPFGGGPSPFGDGVRNVGSGGVIDDLSGEYVGGFVGTAGAAVGISDADSDEPPPSGDGDGEIAAEDEQEKSKEFIPQRGRPHIKRKL